MKMIYLILALAILTGVCNAEITINNTYQIHSIIDYGNGTTLEKTISIESNQTYPDNWTSIPGYKWLA